MNIESTTRLDVAVISDENNARITSTARVGTNPGGTYLEPDIKTTFITFDLLYHLHVINQR